MGAVTRHRQFLHIAKHMHMSRCEDSLCHRVLFTTAWEPPYSRPALVCLFFHPTRCLNPHELAFVHTPGGSKVCPFRNKGRLIFIAITSSSMALIHDTFIEIKIHTAKCDECGKHNIDTVYRCEICSKQLCIPCRHIKGGDATHYMHEGDKGWQPESPQLPAPGSELARPVNVPIPRRPKTKRRIVVEEDSEEDEATGSEPPRERRKETHTRNSSEEVKEAARVEPLRNRTRGTNTRKSSEDDDEAARAEPSRNRKRETHTRDSSEDDEAARAEPPRKRPEPAQTRAPNVGYSAVSMTTAQDESHPDVGYFHPTSILTHLMTQQEIPPDVRQAGETLLNYSRRNSASADDTRSPHDPSMGLASPAGSEDGNNTASASSALSSEGHNILRLLAAADVIDSPGRSPLNQSITASGFDAEIAADRGAQQQESLFVSEGELDLEEVLLMDSESEQEEIVDGETEKQQVARENDVLEQEDVVGDEPEQREIANMDEVPEQEDVVDDELEEHHVARENDVPEQEDVVDDKPEQQHVARETDMPEQEGIAGEDDVREREEVVNDEPEQEAIMSEDDMPAEMLLVEHVSERRPVANRLRVLYRESLLVRAPNGKMVKPFTSGRKI